MSLYDETRVAVKHFQENGFTSPEELEEWTRRIRNAAAASLVPEHVLIEQLRKYLTNIFVRDIEKGGILNDHKGLTPSKLALMKPKLRAELERRVFASANLIKLNRESMISRTLANFNGWASSIPAGGSVAEGRHEVANGISKRLRNLSFEERRVFIDQGAKTRAALRDIVAKDGGAIAAVWRSHWNQSGYDYRPEHKDLDKQVFAVRDNWAMHDGWMVLGGHQYSDEIEQPAEAPYCQCWWKYIYLIELLPEEMKSNKWKNRPVRMV